ncbi:MAG: hypothetical protein ACE5GT_02875 [Rhodospirillales bacterium]
MNKAPRPPRRLYSGAAEPSLDEVLADPIVRTLMARDGVGRGDIRYLVELVRGRAPGPADHAPAAKPFSMTAAKRLEKACGSTTGSPSTIRA